MFRNNRRDISGDLLNRETHNSILYFSGPRSFKFNYLNLIIVENVSQNLLLIKRQLSYRQFKPMKTITEGNVTGFVGNLQSLY